MHGKDDALLFREFNEGCLVWFPQMDQKEHEEPLDLSQVSGETPIPVQLSLIIYYLDIVSSEINSPPSRKC